MPAFRDLLPAPGRATLDVACGEGRLARQLESLGHRVTGIDASPAMVQFAGGHASAGPVVLADAAGLPFRDGAFDLAVAYMCLHDIDDMPHAVAEIARVLGRSGRLCAAIPHPISTAASFQGRDAGAPFVISGSYMQTAHFGWWSTAAASASLSTASTGRWRLIPGRWRPAACSSRQSGKCGRQVTLPNATPLPGGGSAFRSSCTCERLSRDQISGMTGRLDVLLAAAAPAGWLKVR